MVFPSRESCLRVSPALNLGPDCIVRVGRDGDPVAAEVHVVDLTIRVVAPECRAEGLGLGVPYRGPAMCSRKACVGKQGSGAVGSQLESIVRYS